jgi:thiol-disulfide isomerase/thioredoxin
MIKRPSRNRRSFFIMSQRIIVILAIIGITLGYSVYEAVKLEGKLSTPADYYKSNSILKNLPELTLREFDSDKEYSLQELASAGNDLVIHFWATWCGPCEKELPALKKLTNRMEFHKNVKFLFIAVNDKVKDVKKFLKKYDLKSENNILLLVDDDFHHQKSFGTYKLPETYVFSKSFKLLRKFTGPQEWDRPEFYEYLKSL